jgi:DNA-binding NarL/FixJ family response regulator
MNLIKVALADDEVLFRKGLRLLINDFDAIEVMMEASNGLELINQLNVATPKPDVILLDLKMPEMDGIETTKFIHQRYPNIKIIILSTHFKEVFVLHMIELGSASYLPKKTEPHEFERAIRDVMNKGFYYTQEVMAIIRNDMMSQNKIKAKVAFNQHISSRELEILELICNQFTTAEIAAKLFISPRTVDGHRNNLLVKLDCKNTAGLVVYALQNEIVKIYGEL